MILLTKGDKFYQTLKPKRKILESDRVPYFTLGIAMQHIQLCQRMINISLQ